MYMYSMRIRFVLIALLYCVRMYNKNICTTRKHTAFRKEVHDGIDLTTTEDVTVTIRCAQ